LRSGQFWLAVGAEGARKNHTRLLEAYARLRGAGETAYPLVLFGSSGQPTDELGKLIESMRLTDAVQRLGYMEDKSLEWLYANCTAFCYPSLFEGFGLPVVEAMSLGAAILTSRVTSLPEVVGDAAILVDPFDVEAIYAGMRLMATDPSALSRLRSHALDRSAEFSWKRAAAEVLDVYRMLVDEYPRTSERKAVLGAVET
jgi:glycosyltransferase involved in cell wall biosynthesis